MGTPIIGEILSVVLQNKIFGYFLLIAFLIADGTLSVLSGDLFYGVIGSAFNAVFSYFGLPIVIGSEQVLIVAVISPLLLYCLKN